MSMHPGRRAYTGRHAPWRDLALLTFPKLGG